MRVLLGQDAAVAQWAAERIPHVGHGEAFGKCVALGIVDAGGRLAGACVYHNYVPAYRSVEVSFALDGRGLSSGLTLPVIAGLLSYPFSQLACQRLTAVTPRRSASARRFLEKFGFRREGLARRGFGNDDAVIYGMLAKDWRKSRYHPERRARLLGGKKDASASTGA